MEIPTTVTPELERELRRLQPWMHPFRLDERTIVGHFKYQLGDGPTVCTANSPPALVEAMRAAYEDVLRGDPLWRVRVLAERRLVNGSALDIASATGKYTFALADAGADNVLGVEIRSEQVEQAQLLRGLASDRFARTHFELEPTSADDPAFRLGESYDLVLSMGLLYHLTDPVQHLRNLRRLTRGTLMLNTFTTATEPDHWLLVLEDPDEITKAVGGVSWVPHWQSLVSLLRRVGFDEVEIVAPPRLAQLQAWDRRRRGSWELALPLAAAKAVERFKSRRYAERVAEALKHGINARYYTYLAR